MEVIKEGKPYRRHKCSRCKSVYAYRVQYDELICCPICGNFLDFHFFDRKLTREKYKKLIDLKESGVK